MNTKKAFGLVLGLSLFFCTAFAQDKFEEAQEKTHFSGGQLIAEYQIALSIPTFLWAGNPTSTEFLPAGVVFIINGYLYPPGTIGPNNGVNPDGSPEFPDDVIGIWTCRGTLVQPTNAPPTGPGSLTTQYFTFFSSPGTGEDMLITEGYELNDFDLPSYRAGYGTGRWAKYDILSITQYSRGFNVTTGFNLDVEVRTSPNPLFKGDVDQIKE